MCIPLHICLLMVKEAHVPDQRQGKGSVFTGEESGVGQVNKGWKVEKETLFGMRCNIGTLNTLKSLLATLCSSMYMEECWIWHGKEIEKD